MLLYGNKQHLQISPIESTIELTLKQQSHKFAPELLDIFTSILMHWNLKFIWI